MDAAAENTTHICTELNRRLRQRPKTLREEDSESIQESMNEIMYGLELNDLCEGCPHFERHTEHHPYGDGTAPETLVECEASSYKECQRMLAVLE